METTLINEICRLMKGHLSAEQNTILEGTLRKVFKNFNIPEQSEQLSPQSYQTNTRLLNLFISAKKNRRMLSQDAEILFFYAAQHDKHITEKCL